MNQERLVMACLIAGIICILVGLATLATFPYMLDSVPLTLLFVGFFLMVLSALIKTVETIKKRVLIKIHVSDLKGLEHCGVASAALSFLLIFNTVLLIKGVDIDFSAGIITNIVLRSIMMVLLFFVSFGFFKPNLGLKKLVNLTYGLGVCVLFLEYYSPFSLNYLISGTRHSFFSIVRAFTIWGFWYPYAIMFPLARRYQLRHQIDLLQDHIKKNPEDINAYNTLGCRYIELGNNEEALKYFKKVMEINPDHSIASFNIGFAYFKLGKNQEAKDNLQKAKNLFVITKDYENVKEAEKYLKRIP